MVKTTHNTSEPLVLIMMGTFNGEKYIREQLDSIACQSHKNWKLVISDDGSTDRTLEIAEKWASEVGADRVEFRKGPKRGFAQNFLTMACDPHLSADFYAFCDQDDIWKEDKLEVATRRLLRAESIIKPSLYCGRTQYFDHQNKITGFSRVPTRPPSFKNSLVECLAGANTMVFNQGARNVLQAVGVVPAISHDWWLYQLICAINGAVIYDEQPYILYRQHTGCAVGENVSSRAVFKRVRIAMTGYLKNAISVMVACLRVSKPLLNEDARAIFTRFDEYRSGGLWSRTVGLYRLGISRQTLLGTIGLYFLMAIRRA